MAAGPAAAGGADSGAEEPRVSDVVKGEMEVTDSVPIEDKPEHSKA